MTIEAFLDKFEKVKSSGHGKWMASCPCHSDRNPSVSIKDDNGVILMQCFGCGASGPEIAQALGLDISELFPASDNFDASKAQYKRSLFPAGQVLEGLHMEIFTAWMIAKDMIENGTIDQETKERLWQTVVRINAALEYTRRL